MSWGRPRASIRVATSPGRNRMADHDDVMWLHARREISIVEVADASGLTEAEVLELIEYGALSPCQAEPISFQADCIARLRTATRLRDDLELETHAFALVLSFLERIASLEA